METTSAPGMAATCANMAEVIPASYASPVALSEIATGKKRKFDEIDGKEDGTINKPTDSAAPKDDDAVNKKPKISEDRSLHYRDQRAQPSLHDTNTAPTLTEVHSQQNEVMKAGSSVKVNDVQLLKKQKQTRVDMKKKGRKGTTERIVYAASRRKVMLNPHHTKVEAEDKVMVGRDTGLPPIEIQEVVMDEAEDGDVEMENAQPVACPISLEAMATIMSFNQKLPAMYDPWHLTFARPHARYDQPTTCPINWSAFQDLEQADKDAYELRAPWNPKPESWTAAVANYRGDNKITSPEGLRKRFKRANLAIFEATRAYFHMSSLGLEKHGIPVDAKLPALEKEADAAHEAAAAIAASAGSLVATPSQEMSKKEKKMMKHRMRKEARRLFGEASPPVTIQTLLAKYSKSRQFGTTADSDVILDDIYRVLQNEKTLDIKYGGDGAICEGDCNDAVRLLDLRPDDVAKLWWETSVSDPIRILLIDVFLFQVDDFEQAKEQRRSALHSSSHARELYEIFSRDHRQAAIESFVESVSYETFCELYHHHHDHHNDEVCYRACIADTGSIKKAGTSHRHIFRFLEINDVCDFRIENKAGIPMDMQRLINSRPEWNWERVKSVNYHIQIPPRGPQIRDYAPVYYESECRDLNGHFPSHPNYSRLD